MVKYCLHFDWPAAGQGLPGMVKSRVFLSMDQGAREFVDCHSWSFQLSKLLDETKLTETVHESIVGLQAVGIDVEELKFILNQARKNMEAKLKLKGFEIVPTDHALAIYIYTIEKPSVYAAINSIMFSADRSMHGMPCAKLISCMSFIKFLDHALLSLPMQLRFNGRVYRGVKWVFPSTEKHDPENYFFQGRTMQFFEFKSSSKSHATMFHERFCGHEGPRTVFIINATEGYDISLFSHFGEGEDEVLFRPLSTMKVLECAKLNDPLRRIDSKGGFPDNVTLLQTSAGHEYAPGALDPTAADAASACGDAMGGLSQASDDVDMVAWIDEHLSGFFDATKRRTLASALGAHDITVPMLLDDDGGCTADIGLTTGQKLAVVRAIKLSKSKVPSQVCLFQSQRNVFVQGHSQAHFSVIELCSLIFF